MNLLPVFMNVAVHRGLNVRMARNGLYRFHVRVQCAKKGQVRMSENVRRCAVKVDCLVPFCFSQSFSIVGNSPSKTGKKYFRNPPNESSPGNDFSLVARAIVIPQDKNEYDSL